MQFSKIVTTLCLAVCSVASAQEAKPVELVPTYAKIPVSMGGLFNLSMDMTAEVFKPEGPAPFPVVVYSHGRSSTAQERADIKEVVPRDYLRFWLSRGFAVVAPMRPGYGKTGGQDREIPGHSWDANGTCLKTPNYRKVMDLAFTTVVATLAWLPEQPWANPSSVVLTGNSVGGILTMAAGSHNLAGVKGLINFAGGIGGNPSLSPGKSCDPDQLREMYAGYGKKVTVPSLWMYAENDQFWGPDTPKGWHASFVQGGSTSTLVTTPPLLGRDGHDLIFVGKNLWTPSVEAFVNQLGL